MLAGIVEALHRDGHSSILLDLSAVDAADAAGLAELDALRNRMRAAGGHLTVLAVPSPSCATDGRQPDRDTWRQATWTPPA